MKTYFTRLRSQFAIFHPHTLRVLYEKQVTIIKSASQAASPSVDS